MNPKTCSVNKSENPRRCSTSLKAIALAATFAIVFWSFQANAYPLHNGEYLFWPVMPKASRVLADMKGTNDFDTAVRQTAALGLLRDLVKVDMDGKGLRYAPAREDELDTAYVHALPKGNGNVYEISAKALRLQADPSFVEPFLKRYFSEAAVREIEPMVPDLEADALNNVAQVEALAKREAASPKKQTFASQNGLTSAQVEDLVDAGIAFYLIFMIMWLVKIFRSFGSLRMTSDDPPQFRGRLKSLKVYTFTGYVRGSATRSNTTVSGSISTAGNRVQGNVSSHTTLDQTFRLVDPRNQQEHNFQLRNWDVQLFENQLVSVAWANRKHRNDGPVFIVVNHTTGEHFLKKNVMLVIITKWNPSLQSVVLIRNIILFIAIPPVLLLDIFWQILIRIQAKRFISSGVQPLVKALNQKAKEFVKGSVPY
jgi:hypothetical protein